MSTPNVMNIYSLHIFEECEGRKQLRDATLIQTSLRGESLNSIHLCFTYLEL